MAEATTASIETKPTAPPPAAPVAAKEPAPRKLPESRFRLAEQVRNIWNIVPEEGTAFEALKDPAYWVHNSRKMRPGDLIEVVPDEESYWAMLRVRSVTPGVGAQVSVLLYEKHQPASVPGELAQHYEVKWKGPHHKHSVIRIATGETVKPGFDTPEMASRWILDNAKALAVPAKVV